MMLKFETVLRPILTRLNYFCDKSIVLNENNEKVYKELITIKICGDGTNIARVKKVLNFNFSVQNDRQFCKTAKGCFSIGVFEIADENYEHLYDCISKIINDIFEIKSITINGIIVIFSILKRS
jgi:hypothetical protein